ncbi:hypothetical protein NIES3806_40120 [Microcystis aeruginosa NIES-3806]|nr:hypothetical protein NIES3806_40120 [Microcystis aeruginosa NIES-3806]
MDTNGSAVIPNDASPSSSISFIRPFNPSKSNSKSRCLSKSISMLGPNLVAASTFAFAKNSRPIPKRLSSSQQPLAPAFASTSSSTSTRFFNRVLKAVSPAFMKGSRTSDASIVLEISGKSQSSSSSPPLLHPPELPTLTMLLLPLDPEFPHQNVQGSPQPPEPATLLNPIPVDFPTS